MSEVEWNAKKNNGSLIMIDLRLSMHQAGTLFIYLFIYLFMFTFFFFFYYYFVFNIFAIFIYLLLIYFLTHLFVLIN